MYQKRSAWILTGIAPNKGNDTDLQDIEFAIQTEIPIIKQHLSDMIWAFKGRGINARRYNRLSGEYQSINLYPSTAQTIAQGFAMVARFFPGARDVLAQIDDEIQSFNKGLDTLLGEKGITLSGGQRQRLTIARALLSDPPILVLDDALSMVDTRTEERILNQILEFRKNKTNLIVSHRLSTIIRADLIVVLSRGELIEAGDHQTLLNMANEYTRLYERQLLAQELDGGGS